MNLNEYASKVHILLGARRQPQHIGQPTPFPNSNKNAGLGGNSTLSPIHNTITNVKLGCISLTVLGDLQVSPYDVGEVHQPPLRHVQVNAGQSGHVRGHSPKVVVAVFSRRLRPRKSSHSTMDQVPMENFDDNSNTRAPIQQTRLSTLNFDDNSRTKRSIQQTHFRRTTSKTIAK